MSKQQPIDYNALAQQARQSAPVDYTALAAQVRTNPNADILRDQAAKFPTAAESGRPIEPQSVFDQMKALPRKYVEATTELDKGIAKEGLSFIQGGGKLIRSIPGIGPLLAKGPEFQIKANLEPSNTAQAIGKTGAQIAEFFIPATAAGKLQRAASTGRGLLDALFRAGIEGVSAGAVSSAQQGNMDSFDKTAASTAALTGATGAAAKGLGLLGEKVEDALVKASAKDRANGFDVRNIFKHDVGGSLSQTYDKVTKKLSNLSTQLKGVLKGSAPQADIAGVEQKTLNRYSGNAQAAQALGRIREAVEFELNKNGAQFGQSLDLANANIAKQAVGDLGAWLHDPHGKIISDADRIVEDVANTYYGFLKSEIEQKAPPGIVKLLNGSMSELIPIKQAIIRRIPIEQRSNVLNMGDLLGLSSGTIGLSIANRILKSGQAANMAVKAGQSATDVSNAMGRVGAGIASQLRQNSPQ